MSCGQIALNRIGLPIQNYYASEVDKHAIREAKANFPNTIHIGSVTGVNPHDLPPIDLLIGGSPCQSFSFAGKSEGMISDTKEEIVTLERYLELKNNDFKFKGQSYLFWEYARILKGIQKTNSNVLFLLENVVMAKKWEDIINQTLGVKPIKINSNLVSAQNRVRLYWTNIPDVSQPQDKGVTLQDILEDTSKLNPAAIRGRYVKGGKKESGIKTPSTQCLEVRKANPHKSNCLTTVQKDNVLTDLPFGRYEDVYNQNYSYRHYSLTELCRLQTVPEDYFKASSLNQAQKMLGNGWTVDVISHILKNV